ncbi:sigma-70 family RNA polymerase sigma factor [Streptomyces sp. NPDC048696]|uniref:sigma-70 family RNA polymerase sigma factor n=1 Tax=Streptomyces sp. NPDC048696 TaxID=3365585 RepID=UPI003711C6BD
MTHLTEEMISAAKGSDGSAISALIDKLDSLIVSRALDYATRGGRTDYDIVDDLAQAGRIRIWESLEKFEGSGRGEFLNYVEMALRSAMTEHRREITCPGVSPATAKDFERAIEIAAGDPYAAVRIAITDAMGPRKMTRDRAYAALRSWLGTESLDHLYEDDADGELVTLGDVLASEIGVPADLLEPRDYETATRKAVRSQVHRVLGLLSERQRHVLKADHGIAPVGYYGDGPDAVLADDMGVTPYQVKQARVKGKNRFAELYRAGAQSW